MGKVVSIGAKAKQAAPTIELRNVVRTTPTRPKNKDVRSREHLTPAGGTIKRCVKERGGVTFRL